MENNLAYTILENVLFLKKNALFASISTGELRAVAAIATVIVFESGDEIIRENEIDDSVYLIKRGAVLLRTKRNGKYLIINELLEGDHFGELAAFGDEPWQESIVAKERCEILKICSDDLIELMKENSHIGIAFLKNAAKKVRIAETVLNHYKGD